MAPETAKKGVKAMATKEERRWRYSLCSYKAGEAMLNRQGRQGNRLIQAHVGGRLQWEAGDEPVQYRVILCSPGKKEGEIKKSETLVENAQTKGWQYVGLQGDAHIFMATMEAGPIFSSPGAELEFSIRNSLKRVQLFSLIAGLLWVWLLALLLPNLLWRNLVSSNLALLVLPLLLFLIGSTLWQVLSIQLFIRKSRRATSAGGDIPAPAAQQAGARGRAGNLVAILLLAVILAAAFWDFLIIHNPGAMGGMLLRAGWIMAIPITVALYRNRTFQQSRFPWYFLTGALGVALAILELATSSASRETPPPSMEALAQLPVLSGVVAEEPERALTTQGKTPLGAAYAYREWEGSNSLYSAYCRGAFPSLADALYQEALGGFLPARYRHTDMEPISIPGYDQAAQSTDGRTLALQRGLEVYLIDYDPAYFSQGEILALLPRMYGD